VCGAWAARLVSYSENARGRCEEIGEGHRLSIGIGIGGTGSRLGGTSVGDHPEMEGWRESKSHFGVRGGSFRGRGGKGEIIFRAQGKLRSVKWREEKTVEEKKRIGKGGVISRVRPSSRETMLFRLKATKGGLVGYGGVMPFRKREDRAATLRDVAGQKDTCNTEKGAAGKNIQEGRLLGCFRVARKEGGSSSGKLTRGSAKRVRVTNIVGDLRARPYIVL